MDRAKIDLNIGSTSRPFYFRPGSSDEAVMTQIFKQNDYSFGRLRRGQEIADFYHRIAASTKSPLIVDAGANIGASSVYFAYSFPKAQVVAIEPEQSNFDLLQANSQGMSIDPIRCALAAGPASVNLVDPGVGHWGYRTSASPGGEQNAQSVKCITVNEIYASRSQDCSPFVVKIDIEGGESDLFSTNTEWVATTPLIIIELHDWLLPGKATSRSFLQCIAGQDRDFVYIGENIFSIDNNLTKRCPGC
jgi:FkbM family methyltransferase